MLTMNITKLSHAEMADVVSQRCSQFGRVREVTILRPLEKPQVAFALVGMTSDNEVACVVDKLGAAKVDSLAVLRIEQDKEPLPQVALSRKLQPDWAALV